jgi:hypothetical protein
MGTVFKRNHNFSFGLGYLGATSFSGFCFLYLTVVDFFFCYLCPFQQFASHPVQLGRKSEEGLGFAFYWVAWLS